MVQKGQGCGLLISCMLFMVLTVAHTQENMRRAVTEHQLMHDRGRSIQSLKRLIWLSSAIERLHTADTRSLSSSLSFSKDGDDDDDADESKGDDSSRHYPVMDSSVHQGALELLLRDMYKAPPPSERAPPPSGRQHRHIFLH